MLPPLGRRHLLLLLLYPLVGLGYAACEALVPHVVHVMEWPAVDRFLPFVPWMVWPYLFWYAAIVFTLAWTGWRDPDGFRRYVTFLYVGMGSAFVAYLLYPNGQLLRPPLEALGGWDGAAIRWIYQHDTPTNCNPSIHVIDAAGTWIALGRDPALRTNAFFQVGLAVTSVAIMASTVLIKQHSIVDVIGGLLWAGGLYLLFYSRWSPVFRFRHP